MTGIDPMLPSLRSPSTSEPGWGIKVAEFQITAYSYLSARNLHLSNLIHTQHLIDTLAQTLPL